MVPTVKHGGGVMVWGGFAGDTVGDLFKIEATLNQHGYHSILLQHAIPSGLRLVVPSFIFQQDNDPKHTSRLCEGLFDQGQWWSAVPDDLASTVTWPKPNRDGLGWDGPQSEGKRAQQVLSISGNSFKTVGKPFQETTSWISSREYIKVEINQLINRSC